MKLCSQPTGLAIFLLLAAVACGSDQAGAPAANEEEEASAPVAEVLGSVEGRLFFGDDRPPVRKVQVTKDHAVCGTQKESEMFMIADSGGLANVVVEIQGIAAPAGALPSDTVTVEQQGCDYKPHVQAVFAGPDGVTLNIKNSDGILHNIHGWFGEETAFNLAQPPALTDLSTEVDTSGGPLKVVCDVHEWMSAHVVFVDHPFFAVTDAEGNFHIEGIPVGTYTITAWHEALGELEKTVTITDGGVATVDFEILPR